MKKRLLTIEFRYSSPPDSTGSTCNSDTITIGIYDSIEEAVAEGNKIRNRREAKIKSVRAHCSA